MSRRKWMFIVASLCIAGACSSSSSDGAGTSTTVQTPNAAIGTIADRAWHDVALGTFSKKAWTVSYALSTARYRCYDPQGAAQPAATSVSSLGSGTPTHLGHPSRCLPPSAPGAVAKFTAFIAGPDAAGQWVLVGAVTDGVKKARIGFANGTSTALNIDPRTRLVVWKGPASLRPKQLQTDATSCVLDPAQRRPNDVTCDGLAA